MLSARKGKHSHGVTEPISHQPMVAPVGDRYVFRTAYP